MNQTVLVLMVASFSLHTVPNDAMH